jgi:hypothetical protein
VYAGKLDICEVHDNDLPDGDLKRLPRRYADADWAIPEGQRLLLSQPHVVLRYAGIEVAPGSVTLLGDAWEGHEPPEGADQMDAVLHQRLHDCTCDWPADQIEAAQQLSIETLRGIFSTRDEQEIRQRLDAAL